MKKELFKLLYAVSLGAWMTSMFIAACYDNPIPMWVLLVIMNVLYILKEKYNT